MIVLDTHVWIWWLSDPERLADRARKTVTDSAAARAIYISDNAIAVRSVQLVEPFHNDPADRIIVATAITMGVPVISSDAKILKYPHVKSIWK